MKIVTGHTGIPHITSNDDQARNQSIFGSGNSVFNIGNKFALTINSATSVTMADGEGMMQGVQFRIEPGETETLSMSPGTPGYNRIDLICARYVKDATTGYENVVLAVIEGEPATGTPTQPTYTQGNILTGDTLAEYPLYKITFTGVTPAAEKLFRVFKRSEAVSVGVTLATMSSGSTDVPFEAGIYAVSGTVSIVDPVIQSGTQQNYEITAFAEDTSNPASKISVKDATGLRNVSFNGLIVVNTVNPYIQFSASVGSSAFAGAEAWFNLNITKIG